MIIVLGATGYIGKVFQNVLSERGEEFLPLSREHIDYTHYESLVELLRSIRPDFLINAAGYTGKPNVDACETARADALQGNVLFPQTASHACDVTGTPWGHVSSGCIYSGAVIERFGTRRVEADMTTPAMQALVANEPSAIHGFRETDPPNFSFRSPPCSFYSGTKALGEEALAADRRAYLWRLRIPFDAEDSSRNYLSKLQRYSKVYDNVNSVSHVGDFVRACLDLWNVRAPAGIYNVTNPGFVTSRQVVGMIERILRPRREFQFWESDVEFYRAAAQAPRSNCVLDTSKLLSCGINMRCIEEALSDALENWTPEAALAETI